MRRPALIFGLLLSNTALVAVVIWLILRTPSANAPSRFDSKARPKLSSSSAAPVATVLPSAPPEPLGSAPTSLPEPPSLPTNRPHFDWRQVESADYQTYIKNLRAIGCPEETVKDIVAADLLQAFATRRAQVMAARYQDFQFWKSDSTESATRAQLETRRREVDEEMTAALTSLLGTAVTPPTTKSAWQQAALNQQLAFLPDEKRAATEALLLQAAELDDYHHNFSSSRIRLENPAERARVLEAYDQNRAALKEFLTPAEFEQLELTVSWTADNLRRAMTKFQPTEDEFRLIFREWRAHDDNLARLRSTGKPDPGNDHVFARIKEQLPPERYELYRSTWWK